ncbi:MULTISPECIES: nuclease-related domain-containing protein [Methanobacterium]|uniref:Nuclease-related domain-containing protein n=1 Tax=Methanobacterium veterum TaxID=408577 RepID=A0A9E5A8E8_9EURY|nr:MULTISPECIES: nuclease-related domain-containing protein [Methanobacterium]MCZ3367334.1 nuclease-related domain-containing protein [Methanobacterium veterum]MCZ3373518.1 nuclease-related domain-containing protein [Methanobacterium veterum]
MGYLICDNCDIYYELDEDFNDFDTCQNCGNKLNFYSSFDEYYKKKSGPQREKIAVGKGYAEKKSSKYNSILIIGAVFILIGLLGFIVTFLSLLILVIGVGLIYYGYNNGKSWNKGINGEYIVAEYLNQLPEDYFVFNDVKFPGSYGNLDHVVVGPTGVYVIETKNYEGFFLVKGNDWFYKNGSRVKKAKGQPGKQVMANSLSLKKFLEDNGVNINCVWINSIVTLIDNNFKIEQKPEYYNVLFPSTIPQFILNSNRKIDMNILKEVVLLIEPYCIELSYMNV